jgi:hypothetical protein
VELSDFSPTQTDIRLVNDSRQPIEAFYVSQHRDLCGAYSIHDALQGWGSTQGDIHGADSRPYRGASVEPGGWWNGGFVSHYTDNNGDHECLVEIDAVIFGDGSYEGKEEVVQGLKAYRDGIRASVNDWSEKLKGESWDESSLSTLSAEAALREAGDRHQQSKYPFNPIRDETKPLMRWYWEGREQVEENTAIQLSSKLTGEEATGRIQKVAHIIALWKKKIDNDLSLQRLDAKFPPISESDEDSANFAVQP